MKFLTQIVLLLVCFYGVTDASACSCMLRRGTEHEQIAIAFGESGNVFVAKLVTSQISPDSNVPSGKYSTEDAIFEVVEVLKGNYKVGDSIHIQSSMGPGSCGISSRNNPVWMLQAERQGPKVIETPLHFSAEWLIYVIGGGTEPIELSLCERSSPLNLRGGRDLKYLRQIVKKYRLN